MTILALVAFVWVPIPAQADPDIVASLQFSVEGQAYDNSVLAAYIGDILYPRIVIDRGTNSAFYGTAYLIGIDNAHCGRLAVVRSFDQGQTWEPRTVTGPCLSGLSIDVVIDEIGTLYAAAWGPKILRSEDGGLSWSWSADLGNASAPSSISYDHALGALYVAWAPSDAVDGEMVRTLEGPIDVSSSRDGGRTWTQPVSILTATLRGSYPQVTAFNDSVVVASVAKNATADPFVTAVTSADGGRSWAHPTELSPPNPCASWADPTIAVSPSGLFAISWYESRGATVGPSSCWDDAGLSTETWVSTSRDGQGFSGPVRAGGPPVWPSIGYVGGRTAFDDWSRLYVTWHSVSAEGATIYVSVSDLKGEFQEAFFTTHLTLSAGYATGQQNLAVGPDGSVFVAWRAEVYPFEAPTSGIFVRGVSGVASGEVLPADSFSGDSIAIELREPADARRRAVAPWTGSTVVLEGLPPANYSAWLSVGDLEIPLGALPVVAWGRTSFTIRLEGPSAEKPRGPVTRWATLAVAAAILCLAGVLATLQYTRIEREDVFQRKIRLVMFDYVREHPGSSFSEVRDMMGLRNGVAAYHLGVLETQGLLHSESRRRRRWYYANGDIALWKELPISPLQRSLLDEVRRTPGIGIRELARATDRRPSSVWDNVKALSREGLLRTEKFGRKVQCFPRNDGTAS